MIKNEIFPQWLTADIIIPKSILNKFAIRIWPIDDYAGVVMGFLPYEVFACVPIEYTEKFEEIYYTFSMWAFDKLNTQNIFQDFINTPNTDQSRFLLEDRLRIEEIRLLDNKGISLKTILSACLGCKSAIYIPKELRDKLNVSESKIDFCISYN